MLLIKKIKYVYPFLELKIFVYNHIVYYEKITNGTRLMKLETSCLNWCNEKLHTQIYN